MALRAFRSFHLFGAVCLRVSSGRKVNCFHLTKRESRECCRTTEPSQIAFLCFKTTTKPLTVLPLNNYWAHSCALKNSFKFKFEVSKTKGILGDGDYNALFRGAHQFLEPYSIVPVLGQYRRLLEKLITIPRPQTISSYNLRNFALEAWKTAP